MYNITNLIDNSLAITPSPPPGRSPGLPGPIVQEKFTIQMHFFRFKSLTFMI